MKKELTIIDKAPDADNLGEALGLTEKKLTDLTAAVLLAGKKTTTISGQMAKASEVVENANELAFLCFQVAMLRSNQDGPKELKDLKQIADLLGKVDKKAIKVKKIAGGTAIKIDLNATGFKPEDTFVATDESQFMHESFGITKERKNELMKRCKELGEKYRDREGINLPNVIEDMAKNVKHINELVYVSFALGRIGSEASSDGDRIKRLFKDLGLEED